MLLQTCCRRFASATTRPVTSSVMPLRAKITNPAISGGATRGFKTDTEIKELPGDTPNDVLFDKKGGVRSILLNRPKKLNSLDGSMIRKIAPRMREWSKSDLANVIVIKGEGRAFCAGGDVASLALQNKQGSEGQQASKDYFALEYKLDHLISTYKKPYVAFNDGITMGGGVGLSLHAPFRIATENTVFAMPETNIGFFPDVGASFFLPKLDGGLGTYLALTSEQLKGVQVFYAGVATHYLHSSSLPDLEARLAELEFKDHATLQARLHIVNSTIEEFNTGVPFDQPVTEPLSGDVRRAIDYVFQSGHNITDILRTLKEDLFDEPRVSEWAKKTHKTILSRSPTSVKVSLEALRQGKYWSIAEAFRREHTIASKFMEHPDFIEGVSALLIDKPKRTPNWTPATLEEVSDDDVKAFFATDDTLELLDADSGSTGEDYQHYPHDWIGLPSESRVQKQVRDKLTAEEIVDAIVKEYNGKQGVREKVQEVLVRKTTVEDGQLTWN